MITPPCRVHPHGGGIGCLPCDLYWSALKLNANPRPDDIAHRELESRGTE